MEAINITVRAGFIFIVFIFTLQPIRSDDDALKQDILKRYTDFERLWLSCNGFPPFWTYLKDMGDDHDDPAFLGECKVKTDWGAQSICNVTYRLTELICNHTSPYYELNKKKIAGLDKILKDSLRNEHKQPICERMEKLNSAPPDCKTTCDLLPSVCELNYITIILLQSEKESKQITSMPDIGGGKITTTQTLTSTVANVRGMKTNVTESITKIVAGVTDQAIPAGGNGRVNGNSSVTNEAGGSTGKDATEDGRGREITEDGRGREITEDGRGREITEDGRAREITEDGRGREITEDGRGREITEEDRGRLANPGVGNPGDNGEKTMESGTVRDAIEGGAKKDTPEGNTGKEQTGNGTREISDGAEKVQTGNGTGNKTIGDGTENGTNGNGSTKETTGGNTGKVLTVSDTQEEQTGGGTGKGITGNGTGKGTTGDNTGKSTNKDGSVEATTGSNPGKDVTVSDTRKDQTESGTVTVKDQTGNGTGKDATEDGTSKDGKKDETGEGTGKDETGEGTGKDEMGEGTGKYQTGGVTVKAITNGDTPKDQSGGGDSNEGGTDTDTGKTQGGSGTGSKISDSGNSQTDTFDTRHSGQKTVEIDGATPSSGNFMAYFLTAVVLCIAGYVVFHNKQKIIAFIIEGRSTRQRRRANGGGEYKKLQSNVEEVMPSLDKSTSARNFIY